MKLPLIAICALMPLCAAPILAADDTAAPAKTLVDADAKVAVIDPRAVALLDRAVKAYASRPQSSQKFSVATFVDGESQPSAAGSGTLLMRQPKMVRLDAEIGTKKFVHIAAGGKLTSQIEPKTYQEKEIGESAIRLITFLIPWSAQMPLSSILDGRNLLETPDKSGVSSAKVTAKKGDPGIVIRRQVTPDSPELAYLIFLDPKTDLVSRIEMAYEIASKPGQTPRKILKVTEFAPGETAADEAAFRFMPAPGVTLAQAPTPPKYFDERLVVGAKPFDLTGKTLEGTTLSLDSYKGKVVLLDFWATWCGPCIGELPNVKANYDKYKPQGFDIVAVSLDGEEDEQKLRDFIQTKAMPWPQIYDGKAWDAGDAKNYGVKAIPFTLLIGKDGKIAAVNPRGAALEPAVQAALAR